LSTQQLLSNMPSDFAYDQIYASLKIIRYERILF
jgi:hypothetical protein